MGIRLAGVNVPGIFPMAETFIWSFHVSLFLFLSGQVYTLTGGWKAKGTRLNFIKHKAITLGVPYIIFSVIYILINSFSGGANNQSSYADIFMIWKTPTAQYWFLYALFFLFVIWALLGKFKTWQITLCIVALAYIVPFFGGSFGFFEFVMYSALPFGLGSCIKISTVNKGQPTVKIAIILLHVALCAILIKLGVIGVFGVKEAVMFFGIYASILLVSMLSKLRFISRFLDFINKYSFQTYLLHTIFTAGVRILLLKLNVTHWSIHLAVGLVAGILCSVVAAKIAERIQILNKCFFPLKSLRRSDKND